MNLRLKNETFVVPSFHGLDAFTIHVTHNLGLRSAERFPAWASMRRLRLKCDNLSLLKPLLCIQYEEFCLESPALFIETEFFETFLRDGECVFLQEDGSYEVDSEFVTLDKEEDEDD